MDFISFAQVSADDLQMLVDNKVSVYTQSFKQIEQNWKWRSWAFQNIW